MSRPRYIVKTTAAVALTAVTAKTALMVITPATFGGQLSKFRIGFDSVTASHVPVFWEIVRSTNATNSTPGTANTSESANIQQANGRIITAGFTAFSASTSEPTALTVVESNYLTPVGGLLFYDFPLDTEIDWDVSAGLGIRLTAPSGVNARCGMWVERI